MNYMKWIALSGWAAAFFAGMSAMHTSPFGPTLPIIAAVTVGLILTKA